MPRRRAPVRMAAVRSSVVALCPSEWYMKEQRCEGSATVSSTAHHELDPCRSTALTSTPSITSSPCSRLFGGRSTTCLRYIAAEWFFERP